MAKEISELKITYPLSEQVAAQVWSRLHDKARERCVAGDPLEKAERELYNALTEHLKQRASQ